jgi:hypothetical protein
MFCAECGKPISSRAKFCTSCGFQSTVHNNPPQKPQVPVESTASIEPIWNPLVIVLWSFLFGPVWGVTLAWLNWKRLGDAARVRSTSRWITGAVVFTYFTNKVTSTTGMDDMTALFVALAFLWSYIFLWVLLSHRVQISRVRASFGASYQRRSWLWPIVIGVGLYVLLGLLQYWKAQLLTP